MIQQKSIKTGSLGLVKADGRHWRAKNGKDIDYFKKIRTSFNYKKKIIEQRRDFQRFSEYDSF